MELYMFTYSLLLICTLVFSINATKDTYEDQESTVEYVQENPQEPQASRDQTNETTSIELTEITHELRKVSEELSKIKEAQMRQQDKEDATSKTIHDTCKRIADEQTNAIANKIAQVSNAWLRLDSFFFV